MKKIKIFQNTYLFHLKKIKDQISKNKGMINKNVKENDNFTPSINEIMNALKTLNKIT